MTLTLKRSRFWVSAIFSRLNCRRQHRSALTRCSACRWFLNGLITLNKKVLHIHRCDIRPQMLDVIWHYACARASNTWFKRRAHEPAKPIPVQWPNNGRHWTSTQHGCSSRSLLCAQSEVSCVWAHFQTLNQSQVKNNPVQPNNRCPSGPVSFNNCIEMTTQTDFKHFILIKSYDTKPFININWITEQN